MGRKRASPGIDAEKNPLGDVDLSEAHSEKLDQICEEAKRVDIFLGMRRSPPKYIILCLILHWVPAEFLSLEKFDSFLLKRREVLKSIPRFWPIALSNHPNVSVYAVHHQDQIALNYLEDVWLARDPEEKRCFTLEFVRRLGLPCNPSRGTHMRGLQHFRENPFFSDSVLKKEYKHIPPEGFDNEKKDKWGVTDAQAAFSWDVNVEPQVPGDVSTYPHQWFTPVRSLGYYDPLEG